MTFSGDGGTRVPAPRCEPWPHGLLTAAEFVEMGDNEWSKGLEFDQDVCATGGPKVLSMPCPPPIEQHKEAQRGFDTEYSDAFIVYRGYECTSGVTPTEEAWDHADGLLESTWKWGVERAFWTGVDQDGNTFRMSLALSPDVVDLTPGGGAPGLQRAVSILEGYMSDFPCVPTIHAPIELASAFSVNTLLRPDGEGWRTAAGSKVALGPGYPGTGPANAAPAAGEIWMFASGGVRITAGPKFFTPARGDLGGAVDTAVNLVTVYAERAFAAQIACGLAAIRVTL